MKTTRFVRTFIRVAVVISRFTLKGRLLLLAPVVCTIMFLLLCGAVGPEFALGFFQISGVFVSLVSVTWGFIETIFWEQRAKYSLEALPERSMSRIALLVGILLFLAVLITSYLFVTVS